MTAILTGGDPDVGATAQALQRYLERAFAVRLPVDPQGGAPGPDLGGVFLLGRRSAQVAGRITDRELEYAGPGGFALHATDGRVALAGADAQGTCAALERYLVDHGIRLFGSGTESVADLRADFLHELYTLDKPWFAECPAWDRWWLNEPAQGEALPLGDPAEALRLAASIKELARSGKHQVSADLLSQAGQTSLSRYVTSRLLRNPLDDATRAAREFIAASRDR
jgi:hypothetical protein